MTEENLDIEFEEVPEEEFVVLTDEDGNESEFEMLDYLTCDDVDYLVLIEVTEEEPEGPVSPYVIRADGEEASEEQLDHAFELFMKRNEEFFEFAD